MKKRGRPPEGRQPRLISRIPGLSPLGVLLLWLMAVRTPCGRPWAGRARHALGIVPPWGKSEMAGDGSGRVGKGVERPPRRQGQPNPGGQPAFSVRRAVEGCDAIGTPLRSEVITTSLHQRPVPARWSPSASCGASAQSRWRRTPGQRPYRNLNVDRDLMVSATPPDQLPPRGQEEGPPPSTDGDAPFLSGWTDRNPRFPGQGLGFTTLRWGVNHLGANGPEPGSERVR